MSCATCDQLRADLAEARAVLAAWEAYEHPVWADRLARWQDAFGAGAQVATLLMLLSDARGRMVSPARLIEATRGLPCAKSEDPHRTLAPVIAWKARKMLVRIFLAEAIETHRGLGYRMPLGAREKVLAMVGEAT